MRRNITLCEKKHSQELNFVNFASAKIYYRIFICLLCIWLVCLGSKACSTIFLPHVKYKIHKYSTCTINEVIFLILDIYLSFNFYSYTRWDILTLCLSIGHVNNIPSMQCLTGISRNTQLILTEYAWDLYNNALWVVPCTLLFISYECDVMSTKNQCMYVCILYCIIDMIKSLVVLSALL